ncbi:hypothetical protein Taro_035409, partial [Colocasia esculenta]|nr:hypothetical protein [Colocasia esculenta]
MATRQEGRHQVRISKTETVYPRPRHPPPAHRGGLLRLSNLDRQCPVLMYLVFFYKSPPPPPAAARHHTSQASLFSSLKRGLEKALAAWYPAAGRLSPDPVTRKLDLVCNGAGAILVEASTDVELSELGDLAQHKSFYEQLVFRPPSSGNVSEVPLVVAQVTRFGCGGYAVGIGTSHSLFDGWANFNFISSWASMATGAAEYERVELARPVHERDGLLLEHHGSQPRQEDASGGHKPAAAACSVLAFDHIYQLIRQAASDHGGDLGGCKYAEIPMSFAGEQHCVLLTYRVTCEMIEKLKGEAMRGTSGGAAGVVSCSSFEVVAAHLWQ